MMENQISVTMIRLVIALCVTGLWSCTNQVEGDRRSDDQQFVTEASSSNSLEIAAGNLAVTNGVSEQVRSFGRQMVEEHTAVGDELMVLAESKGWSATTEMIDKHRNEVERLHNQDSSDFDEEFIDLMISSHEEAVDLFTDVAEGGRDVSDAELRAFAEQKLPSLKMHLEQARKLKSDYQSMDNQNRRDSIN